MLITDSKKIIGVQYVNLQKSSDIKGTRLITYYWTTLLNHGHQNIFEAIYTKSIATNYELDGLYFYPNQKFLFRCVQGAIKLLVSDLREERKTFTKYEIIDLYADSYRRVVIPENIAWGVIGIENDSILGIQTTYSIDFSKMILVDPMDELLKLPLGNIEFAIKSGQNRILEKVRG